MTKTYSELMQEIKDLQQAAQAIKSQEVPVLIARMKRLIQVYGISADDLGFGQREIMSTSIAMPELNSGPSTCPGAHSEDTSNVVMRDVTDGSTGLQSGHSVQSFGMTPTKRREKKIAPKFADEHGNTWSGRGSRPKWLVAALNEGRRIEAFALSSKSAVKVDTRALSSASLPLSERPPASGPSNPAIRSMPTSVLDSSSGVTALATKANALSSKSRRKPAHMITMYKDPESTKTWNGVGRKPSWFVAALQRGLAPNDMLMA